MAESLFRTKSIDHLLAEARATGEGTLKRTLGPWALVALGVGAIIGAGLFVRTAAAIAWAATRLIGRLLHAQRLAADEALAVMAGDSLVSLRALVPDAAKCLVIVANEKRNGGNTDHAAV